MHPNRHHLLALFLAAPLNLWAQSTPAPQLQPERCATRVSIALLGLSADASLFAQSSPQSSAAALFARPEFIERFSSFINREFNSRPGDSSADDASYHLTRYVLMNRLPWSEVFQGPYRVDGDPNDSTVATVVPDPNGLGYFRSPSWLIRYEGNEPDGYKLRTAYRIMNNTIGLKLVMAQTAPGADVSVVGRQAPSCRGCHFDSPFALDKAARVLTRRVGVGMDTVFDPPPASPQTFLNGVVIKDDKDLVTGLIASDAFAYYACRLSFRFLLGRNENKCEGPAFDRCFDAFRASGQIQAALGSIVSDPLFCQEGAAP